MSDIEEIIENEEIVARKQFRGLPTFIALKVGTKVESHKLISSIMQIPDVEDVYEVTGDFDIIVVARTRTSSNLNNVIRLIRMLPGVMDTRSYLALNEYSKE